MSKRSYATRRPDPFGSSRSFDVRMIPYLVDEVDRVCAIRGRSPLSVSQAALGGTYTLHEMRRAAMRLAGKVDALRAHGYDLDEPHEIVVEVTLPTSGNKLLSHGPNGPHRSARYRAWLKKAGAEIIAQRPKWPARALPPGPYGAHILVATDAPGDIDNRVKSLIDLLHRMGVTPDDKMLWDQRITRSPEVTDPSRCLARVFRITPDQRPLLPPAPTPEEAPDAAATT